jgi:hypothetical protein
MARVKLIYHKSILGFKTSSRNKTHNRCCEKPQYDVTRLHIGHQVSQIVQWTGSICNLITVSQRNKDGRQSMLIATIYLSNFNRRCASFIRKPYVLTAQLRFPPPPLNNARTNCNTSIKLCIRDNASTFGSGKE